MAKKHNVPTCLGHYDRGDDVCDGDPEGATDDERMICAWRDRCGGFKAHLEATGKAVVDYVDFPDDDTAIVPDREKFAVFCQEQADKFKVVEGLPTEPVEEDYDDDEEDEDEFDDDEGLDEDEDDEEEDDEEEDEGEEEPDEEEDEGEEEDDEEPDDEEDEEPEDDEDDDASTDQDGDDDDDSPAEEEDDEEDRGDSDFVDGDGDDDEDGGDDADLDDDSDDGEDDDNEEADAGEASKVDAAPSKKTRRSSVKKKKTKKKAKKRKSTAKTKPKGERETNSKWAAKRRRDSLALYKHFEEALSEGLNGYAFTSPKQAPLPGELYVADRRELSGYVSVYCKTAQGRDIPVVSIKMKPRATEIDVDLPVTVKMLRSRLSKSKLAKLDIKQLKGGRFRARMVGLDKEKAAIVAEVVHELVKTEAIKLPKPLWA